MVAAQFPFSRARDRYRKAETARRGEAAGVAVQARGAQRLEPDRLPRRGAAELLIEHRGANPINGFFNLGA